VSLEKNLVLGFAKVHILYHAGREPVYGVWLMKELARHGYRLSPGTLYPMLAGLRDEGLLACERQVVGGKVRKYYSLTPRGREALDTAREKAIELVRELLEDEPASEPGLGR